MKNYVQPGNTITATAPAGGVASGDVLIVGSLVGVCAIAALEGAETEVQLVGVFDLPKVAGAITAGAKVYWNSTAGAVTTTATDNTMLGAAAAAAADADPTVRVRLNGIAA